MYDCIFGALGGKAFFGRGVGGRARYQWGFVFVLSELCLSWFLCSVVCLFLFLFHGISRRGKTIDTVGLGEPGGSCMETTCLTLCLLISPCCDVI